MGHASLLGELIKWQARDGRPSGEMPYQGPHQGQYAGTPAYGQPLQPLPQYTAAGMQYPVQQQSAQPMQQQMFGGPANGGIYSKQYYQPQQQRPVAASQPAHYGTQYAGFQQSQHQQVQCPPVLNGPFFAQTAQAVPSYYPLSPVFPQQPHAPQQQSHGWQHPTFEQQRENGISPQWQNRPMPTSPNAQFHPRQGTASNYPSEQGQGYRMASQPPRQVPPARMEMSYQPHQNVPSSPDPLAPSPSVRQAQPPQRAPVQRQSQPISMQTPVASTPKPNVTQPLHTSQQRIASHVEISVMSQPSKRRRSNDGSPRPVCDGPSVDYQAVLLALSDEYISAAYNLESLNTDEHLEDYHKLIATGIGCLESVLKNYRYTDARKEARIRLRLASLLMEETENDEEAEETLGKGIDLCERSRLTDLKYAMHHLLARLLFKKSSKAALKATEKLIKEVEALQLTHWIYAFRYLRVCFGLQVSGPSETAAMLKHLAAISSTADAQRHVSVQISAATLEAMVHLRSATPDAVELAQRAMASARTHQLGAEMKGMPQVRAVLEILDLCCSLVMYDPKQTPEKMSQMHARLDPAARETGWSDNGSFSIPMLLSTNTELSLDTAGIMKTAEDGMATLNLRWMTQNGIYVVGYLLSGITHMHKDEHATASSFVREGLKLNKNSTQRKQQAQSLGDRIVADDVHTTLDTVARTLLSFDLCVRFEWGKAREAIDQTWSRFTAGSAVLTDETSRTLLYLDAMCKQAQGDLEGALHAYQSTTLAFEPDVKAASFEKDFRVLSALNSIMILRTMGPEGVERADNLHAAVEPYCANHQNKSFSAAYYVTKAMGRDYKVTVVKTKQYLHSAVNAARDAANNQLLFVVMNAMTDLFFSTSVVGDQAEKSGQTARTLAKRGGDNLWLCVADTMYGEILERCGKDALAGGVRQEARSMLMALPEAVKQSLTL